MILTLLTLAVLDLSKATIVATPADAKPAQVLKEEIEKRTWLELGSGPSPLAITLETKAAGNEGYTIATNASGVRLTGNSARGTLYAVGHLLRKLEYSRHQLLLPRDLNIATVPETKLRGHQLGYRPKTNSYDGWNAATWDQYIRELALFGANAIELIPPRSDDDADSPHFPAPPIDMMIAMSRSAQSYGLDVWVWYPALDDDYSKPDQVAFALKEWADVLAKLPRVDHIFVPGGDPGHTPPEHLMPMLEKQAASLKRFHPKVGWWVAPQGFNEEWMNRFFAILKTEPAWLTGLVYGPQSRYTIPRFRELVPARWPVRHYPDITHSLRSQFPVPDWDLAFATTLNREPINPRPVDQAAIFRHTNPHTIGFLTYSEGCNDDVNKFVWSALGWKQDQPLDEILRDYARLFISSRLADSFAQGLLALERNWRGPAVTNTGIDATLQQFQAMERNATPAELQNWRFQQALHRAYYDAAVRHRAIQESALEQQARQALARLDLDAAERALAQTPPTPYDARVHELAEALFQSIRMQLDSTRYQGQPGRGSNLDTFSYPLNDRSWLRHRIQEIRALNSEKDRRARAEKILAWQDPGPGGFYDDLGQPGQQPHLVRDKTYAQDPYFLQSPLTGFLTTPLITPPDLPRSAWTLAETQYDDVLRLRYTGLDPHAQYRLRIMYAATDGASRDAKIRCLANGRTEIHGYITKNLKEPMEFDIPAEATAQGTLDLAFNQAPGNRGAGRGVQIAEVWLVVRR